MGQWRHSIMPL